MRVSHCRSLRLPTLVTLLLPMLARASRRPSTCRRRNGRSLSAHRGTSTLSPTVHERPVNGQRRPSMLGFAPCSTLAADSRHAHNHCFADEPRQSSAPP
ncbi:hypothetical protein B0H13DRAFT_2335371 [Mycena leptocephala]|nr:hypothetical protein B0H13DRAFT_2335371 [Mycena leptocephala]